MNTGQQVSPIVAGILVIVTVVFAISKRSPKIVLTVWRKPVIMEAT